MLSSELGSAPSYSGDRSAIMMQGPGATDRFQGRYRRNLSYPGRGSSFCPHRAFGLSIRERGPAVWRRHQPDVIRSLGAAVTRTSPTMLHQPTICDSGCAWRKGPARRRDPSAGGFRSWRSASTTVGAPRGAGQRRILADLRDYRQERRGSRIDDDWRHWVGRLDDGRDLGEAPQNLLTSFVFPKRIRKPILASSLPKMLTRCL